MAATYILEDFIQSHPSANDDAAKNTSHHDYEETGNTLDDSSQDVAEDSVEASAKDSSQKSTTSQPDLATLEPTKNSRSKKGLILRIIAGFIAVVIILIGLVLGWYIHSISPRTKDDNYAVISVQSGEGTKTIATNLKQKGIIRSVEAFSVYTKLHNIKNLQAGDYRLSSKQSVKTIAQIIASGKVTNVNVLILPGKTLEQITEVLVKNGYSQAEIEKALATVRDHPLLKELPKNSKLEGYLYPETYKIGAGTSAEQFIRLIFNTFNAKITPDIKSGIAAQGLTMQQAVILASIVQKEASDQNVQPSVAQVFISRYKQGIMLGSDVTSLYGARNDGIDLPKNAAEAAAIAIAHDSPYNTRKTVGIPPTAISNFNFSALKAVALPSKKLIICFLWLVMTAKLTFHEPYRNMKRR